MAFTFERTKDGITTVKEGWLDERTGLHRIEIDSRREIYNYIREVEEMYERSKSPYSSAQEGITFVYLQTGNLEDEFLEKKLKLEKEFRELTDAWRAETSMLSSTSDIVSNFNYYRIIGLGKDVVPLILRELQERGGQWFLALRALTNENPVNPEDVGNIKSMKRAWINWGKEQGVI